MDRKKSQNANILSIFLGGPMGPIRPVWALAAIHPRWGNRYPMQGLYLLAPGKHRTQRSPGEHPHLVFATPAARIFFVHVLIFSVQGKNGLRWPQIGPGGFFPTNPNLADILGRTDLDFENFYFVDLLDPKFLDFQVPRFPKSGPWPSSPCC